ncbi:enoyl-CoA hydratase-related protein [uncultured Sphingomonas sp.]|uniref:enoyl-CoA hydratase-related protein n=1 Tax=uncultured Sphingomonas sp. TaxID=158754 RepID=UPI0025D5BA07|nr:enoyl-CoA hydratase-related protein [uncultured Sphingomonas sp.]
MTVMIEEVVSGVMLMTLNRPAQRNAIDLAMADALADALATFEREPRWRVGIVTGAAPAFCAGLDLKAFSEPDAPRGRVTEVIQAFATRTKPMIAAVNGAAYTGGLEIALACDFILAGEAARFADTHAKIGALSGSGMGSRLPRAVGARFARQMMLTCAPIDAVTALRVGLANEVVADASLMARAIALATMTAAYDPEIVAIAKHVIDRGSQATLGEAIEIEKEALARRKAQGAMAWTR